MVLVALIVFGFLVLSLIVKRMRRRSAPAKVQERSEIDTWVEEALAKELGKKTELGADAVLGTLRGDPDPHVVTSLEGAVRKVKLTYERLAQEGEYEVRA